MDRLEAPHAGCGTRSRRARHDVPRARRAAAPRAAQRRGRARRRRRARRPTPRRRRRRPGDSAAAEPMERALRVYEELAHGAQLAACHFQLGGLCAAWPPTAPRRGRAARALSHLSAAREPRARARRCVLAARELADVPAVAAAARAREPPRGPREGARLLLGCRRAADAGEPRASGAAGGARTRARSRSAAARSASSSPRCCSSSRRRAPPGPHAQSAKL